MWLVTRYLNELINSLTWSATVLLFYNFSFPDKTLSRQYLLIVFKTQTTSSQSPRENKGEL